MPASRWLRRLLVDGVTWVSTPPGSLGLPQKGYLPREAGKHPRLFGESLSSNLVEVILDVLEYRSTSLLLSIDAGDIRRESHLSRCGLASETRTDNPRLMRHAAELDLFDLRM